MRFQKETPKHTSSKKYAKYTHDERTAIQTSYRLKFGAFVVAVMKIQLVTKLHTQVEEP